MPQFARPGPKQRTAKLALPTGKKRCRGACLGKEPLAAHGARLLSALAKLQLRPWPYSGAVA